MSDPEYPKMIGSRGYGDASTSDERCDDDGNVFPCRCLRLDDYYTEDDVRDRLIPFLQAWLAAGSGS